MIKKVFSIPNMHCSNCVMRLEGIEDDLEGISQIRGSYHKQTLEVTFDETVVSEDEIRQAITDLGYTAA
jgi:copper chaperone CopZ